MDFVRLVENGTYKKEELREEQKELIRGIEIAMEEIDCMIEPIDEDDMKLDQLVKEIKNLAYEEAKERLYVTMCERIVYMLDNNEAEEK